MHTFGFSFGQDASAQGVNDTVRALDAACLWLDTVCSDGDAVSPPKQQQDVISALRLHMQLRRALIQAQAEMSEHSGRRLAIAPDAVATLRKALASALDAVQAMILAQGMCSSAATQRTGFDSAVSARLLGGALPRAIRLLSLPQALYSMRGYVVDLVAVLDAAAGSSCSTLHGLVSWLDSFTRGELSSTTGASSESTTPAGGARREPATLARSAALVALLPSEEVLIQWALDDLWVPNGIASCSVATPPLRRGTSVAAHLRLWPSPDSKAEDMPPSIAKFLTQARVACDALLRALAASRSRCRRRMRHVTAEWAPLVDTGLLAEGTTPPVRPPMDGGLDASGGSSASVAALADAMDASLNLANEKAAAELHEWVVRCARPHQGAAAAGDEDDNAVAVALGSTWFGSHCLSSWASRWEAWVQASHLEAGFGLQLYDVTELGPLFWYLDYLFTWQIDVMLQGEEAIMTATTTAVRADATAALQAVHAAKEVLDVLLAVPGGDKRAIKRAEQAYIAAAAVARTKQAALQVQVPRTCSVLSRLHATRLMCGAYVRAWLAMRLDGQLRGAIPAKTPFNDEFYRFWQRFGTFHNYTTPPAMHFNQWEEHVESLGAGVHAAPVTAPTSGTSDGVSVPPKNNAVSLFAAAEERFRAACAQLKESGVLQQGDVGAQQAKCAAANMVACGVLAKAGGSVAANYTVSLEPSAQFRGWPVLKLTRQAQT